MTAVYVTVSYHGKTPVDSRPLCAGCTPASIDGRSEITVPPERADYEVVGASGTIAFCRRCAIHSIKSLAARFVMFDPSATRDLMDFFAAEAAKAAKAQPAARKRRNVIEAPVTKLLPAAPRKRSRKAAP